MPSVTRPFPLYSALPHPLLCVSSTLYLRSLPAHIYHSWRGLQSFVSAFHLPKTYIGGTSSLYTRPTLSLLSPDRWFVSRNSYAQNIDSSRLWSNDVDGSARSENVKVHGLPDGRSGLCYINITTVGSCTRCPTVVRRSYAFVEADWFYWTIVK